MHEDVGDLQNSSFFCYTFLINTRKKIIPFFKATQSEKSQHVVFKTYGHF